MDIIKKKQTRSTKGKKWPSTRFFSEETKKKIGIYHKGKIVSKETRLKMSESKKGVRAGMLGKKHSKETLKKISDNRKGKCAGDKCHFWKGGISPTPYTSDWTRFLKISIRERDNYSCRICGEKQGDIAHHVHHIDYKKENCNPDNLITLCIKCHGKMNVNREYWINYFKYI